MAEQLDISLSRVFRECKGYFCLQLLPLPCELGLLIEHLKATSVAKESRTRTACVESLFAYQQDKKIQVAFTNDKVTGCLQVGEINNRHEFGFFACWGQSMLPVDIKTVEEKDLKWIKDTRKGGATIYRVYLENVPFDVEVTQTVHTITQQNSKHEISSQVFMRTHPQHQPSWKLICKLLYLLRDSYNKS